MLTIFGKPQRFCDRVSRRNFLKVGGLAGGALTFGGPTLADVLRADATAPRASKKSIINIFLGGGPSHLDMFDPKPEAGNDYCGPLNNPIATNVNGTVITSSPGPMPAASSARCSALVPVFTQTPIFAPL